MSAFVLVLADCDIFVIFLGIVLFIFEKNRFRRFRTKQKLN